LFGLPVCLLLLVGWFRYSTGLSGRNLFKNTFLVLSRSFYIYISEDKIYTVSGLEKLVDKEQQLSKDDIA